MWQTFLLADFPTFHAISNITNLPSSTHLFLAIPHYFLLSFWPTFVVFWSILEFRLLTGHRALRDKILTFVQIIRNPEHGRHFFRLPHSVTIWIDISILFQFT